MATIEHVNDEEKMERDAKSFIGTIKYGLYPVMIVTGVLGSIAGVVGLFLLLFHLGPVVGGVALFLTIFFALVILTGLVRQDTARKQLKKGREVSWKRVNNGTTYSRY